MPVGAGLFAVLLLFVFAPVTPAADLDADGMPDAYESFFQLDAANPADALLDDDGDSATNRIEAQWGTDPWEADTDRDGLGDAVDEDPLSQMVVPWGDPLYVFSSDVIYAWPPWAVGAWKVGGEWSANPAAWIGTPNASLWVAVDRAALTNDALLSLRYASQRGASLAVGLLDVAMEPVGIPGTVALDATADGHCAVRLPLAAAPTAAVVQLRHQEGDVALFASVLAPWQDGDVGTTAALAPPARSPASNSRQRSLEQAPTEKQRVGEDGDSPSSVVYVDAVHGNDAFGGDSRVALAGEGPKRTLQAAVEEATRRRALRADAGVKIVALAGVYSGSLEVPEGILLTTDGYVEVIPEASPDVKGEPAP